jgi:propane monooxygenase large subunit
MPATTRRRSITKTHERISQLGWEPDYFQPADKYPSRYTFPTKAKDPMKHIMREYLPMELEKDERVYGGQDAAVRAEMTSKTGRRWLEIIKPYIVTTAYAEVAAGRAMSMLIDAVPNNELRNGYHVQFVDEIRHTGMQMALARWYAKHVPDPSGWHLGPATLSKDPGTRQALNMLSHFIVGDPVQCAFTLQVVAETAFTNIAFVALPDVGARNGDFTLPTTYLSVQSDEARHISNGYATLLTVLQEDENAPLIERDLAQAWWINHAYLDGFGSAIMEYSSDDRSDPESYMDKWVRWIENDWYRSYVLKLGKLGLNFPAEMFDRAKTRLERGLVHKNMLGSAAFWMLHFWRTEPLNDRDFEWLEAKYPGWYEEYGAPWEAFRQTRHDPQQFRALLDMSLEDAAPSCWVCLMGCVFPEDMCHRAVDGRTRFYCSKECMWLDESNPGRYVGDRNYFDRYHGWELSEIVRDIGFVRADGKTLIAQPHLENERMWTLDDVKSMDFHVQSPNITVAEKLGLPNGSSVGLVSPNGHIDGGLRAAAPWSNGGAAGNGGAKHVEVAG